MNTETFLSTSYMHVYTTATADALALTQSL